MKRFGETWGAPICAELELVDTPVGWVCLHCDEPIEEGDSGVTMPFHAQSPLGVYEVAEHVECFLRGVVGSVGHQRGTCWCYDKENPDEQEDGMTRREAALAACREAGLYVP